MKRIVSMILLFALFLTGLSFPANSVAESDHPITLTITCDPAPELEGEGTIDDLLFTIRNTGSEDYTLYGAKLFGGYENDEKDIGGDSFTVLAGSSKEFHLTDVPVAEDQLDREITYRLTWDEHETLIDDDTGEATFLTHPRETTASITLERFVIPELTVTASSEKTTVRANETFIVTYTITNDTAFDITGIRLYDPEQGVEMIPLPSSELLSGDSMQKTVEYTMGEEDMTFRPRIEYLSHRREMVTNAETTLTVENVSVELVIETIQRSATDEGTVFAVMVTNRGNRAMTDITVFDEINTQIEEPFTLGPDETHTVICIIKPAVSSDLVRNVRFHVTATDYFGEQIRVDDPGIFKVVPYVEPDSVRLVLSAVLQSPYYNEDGKLCASIQFIIRNNGDVKVHDVVLNELTLFGSVKTYDELRSGDTYLMKVYQLDGVKELRFQVTALDPAGEPCSTDIIRLDLTGLKDLADRKNDAVLVYTQNAYMQDIDARYTGVLRNASIIGLSVAALCAILCVILYAVEIRIRSKLPAEFEDEMEKVLRATKRRAPKQLFTDTPTEQFGYVAPIKLRNYGELTEEEVKERRELYAKRLEENIRKEGGKTEVKPKPRERTDDDGTRVIPVVRRTAPEPQKTSGDTPETVAFGTQVIPVVRRTTPEQAKTPKETADGTKVIPVVRPQAAVDPVPKTPVAPPAVEESEPIRIYEPKRSRPADNPPDTPCESPSLAQGGQETAPAPESGPEPEKESGFANNIAGDGAPDASQKPEPQPAPVTEADYANDSAGDGVPDATPDTEPEPTPVTEADYAYDSAGDVVPDAPQKPEPEPAPVTEADHANDSAGGGVPDAPQKPEPQPAPVTEADHANDSVGGSVSDAPPDTEPEPFMEREPEPAPEPIHTPAPEPVRTVSGPRRAFEKPAPARRPVVLQPIRRTGR